VSEKDAKEFADKGAKVNREIDIMRAWNSGEKQIGIWRK